MARALQRQAYIPPGHVRLTCGDPKLDVTVWLGPEPPTIEAGIGGWNVTERPREVGMTIWGGVEPFQLSLSLMFDGWAARTNQENALANLIAVGRGDRESPPGVLAVEGLALPADDWVIESMEFGDPIYGTDGNRLRQAVTLTLREYVPPEYLRRYKTGKAHASTKHVTVRAKRGDTLAKIAKRRKVKWTAIRDMNRKLSSKANAPIKEGTQVRVPKPKK